jgi:activator of HSP90 ATPase
MKSITKTYLISAPLDKIWDALVNPSTIEEWGGGAAVMNDQPGMEFSLWDGDIFGKNLTVKPREELIQEWYGGEWKEPSIVSFKLKELNGKTELTLFQENIPDNEAPDIDKGWDLYYLGAIKHLLEE